MKWNKTEMWWLTPTADARIKKQLWKPFNWFQLITEVLLPHLTVKTQPPESGSHLRGEKYSSVCLFLWGHDWEGYHRGVMWRYLWQENLHNVTTLQTSDGGRYSLMKPHCRFSSCEEGSERNLAFILQAFSHFAAQLFKLFSSNFGHSRDP